MVRRLWHYFIAVYFMAQLLAPFAEAKEPRAGNVAVTQRYAGAQDYLHLLDRALLLYGEIHLNKSALTRKYCTLDISVEIGESIWKQQLSSSSFAFQVPVRSFDGKIGMISINECEGSYRRLWSHFFVVQDLGTHRLDATLTGGCTKIKIRGRELIPWTPAMCPIIRAIKKNTSLLLFMRFPTDTILICPVLLSSSLNNICNIQGALEIYPTTTNEGRAYFAMRAFLENLRLFVRDQLRHSEESSNWHLVFGVRFLQTWHFHCLSIIFLFLHIANWFLRLLENLTTTLSNLERPVDEWPPNILNEELQTRCPNSDPSLCELSRQASIHSRQDLPLSCDILYRESWGDAHQHLRKLMDSPVDDICNTTAQHYDCTAQRRSFSDLLLHSERWSRDSNGRLIRDHP